MSLRVRVAPLAVVALVIGLATAALPASAGASCPNEEIRAEQGSEWLPDCRAFELVTPEYKEDNSSVTAYGAPTAFPDGNHLYYLSLIPLPGAVSGSPQPALSSRTASGWVSTSLAAPAGSSEPADILTGQVAGANQFPDVAFTSDFSAAFRASEFDVDPLDQNGAWDVYRFDLPSGRWSLAALPDTGPATEEMLPEEHYLGGTFPAGISQDGSHVYFQSWERIPVAPGTPEPTEHIEMLYDRTGGHTYAVGVLSDGAVSQCPVSVGNSLNGEGFFYGAVSPDGSNVVFTTCEGVFLRKDDKSTVELSGGADGMFDGRSSDGSKVFTSRFADEGKAEEGKVRSGSGEGIYEYDIATGQTTTITDEGQFVGSSADGSRVYYLLHNEELYLWHDGANTLIPKAGEAFASNLRCGDTIGFQCTQGDKVNTPVVTPDGSKLLFLDRADITGYDSADPACAKDNFNKNIRFGADLDHCAEAFVYDATTGSITCVSCNPTGALPLGPTELLGQEQKDGLSPPDSEGEMYPNGSRVFFETEDALAPQDTNGLSDVYEWEDGRIHLISSGQGIKGSFFDGAGSDGSDVFLGTTDKLAPQDVETSQAIYDARIDGGFVYKPFTSGCDSGQCQGPQTPAPSFEAPASATFVGVGNPAVAVKVAPAAKSKKATRKHKPKRRRRKHRVKGRKSARVARGSHSKRKGRK